MTIAIAAIAILSALTPATIFSSNVAAEVAPTNIANTNVTNTTTTTSRQSQGNDTVANTTSNQSSILHKAVTANSSQTSSRSRDTTTTQFRGMSADAWWYSEGNGTYTDAYIYATNSAYQQKSTRYNESLAYVEIYQYRQGKDVCQVYNGEKSCWTEYIPAREFFGSASLPTKSSFEMDVRLNKATLNNITVTGYDYISQTNKTIIVNAQWLGLDAISSGTNTYHYRNADYIYNGRYAGSYRDANASATITGDINMSFGSSAVKTSSTSGTAGAISVGERQGSSYQYASLYNAKSGQVEVIRFRK